MDLILGSIMFAGVLYGFNDLGIFEESCVEFNTSL